MPRRRDRPEPRRLRPRSSRGRRRRRAPPPRPRARRAGCRAPAGRERSACSRARRRPARRAVPPPPRDRRSRARTMPHARSGRDRAAVRGAEALASRRSRHRSTAWGVEATARRPIGSAGVAQRVTTQLREHGAARVRERSEALLEEAAERSRPRSVAERLRANWRWFAQAALATAPSWWLAKELFGHPRPIFAPVAGLIAVSTTLGQPRRYAIGMGLGIAIGIGIADSLFTVIGAGTWQIAVIVVGAMVAAVVLDGSVVLISEAPPSALLVVPVQPPGTGLSGARFLDSLLGGLIGLLVTSILPASPTRTVHRAAAFLLGEIALTLEDAATPLGQRDAEPAEQAWTRASEIDPDVLRDAITAGRETLPLAPWLRGARAQFARYASAATQIDNAVSSVEALSRGAVRAISQGDNRPPPVAEALRELADAVRRLESTLDEGGDQTAMREPALRAAARARVVREQTANLSVNLIVVQVRSTAVDLLRGSGLDRDEAESQVREAVRLLQGGAGRRPRGARGTAPASRSSRSPTSRRGGGRPRRRGRGRTARRS